MKTITLPKPQQIHYFYDVTNEQVVLFKDSVGNRYLRNGTIGRSSLSLRDFQSFKPDNARPITREEALCILNAETVVFE